MQVALVLVSVLTVTMANSQYQHGEHKEHGYQPVSYQKKEYNHQPSYGYNMGHGGHSYQQPSSYEHKGYGGYQPKPYSHEKKEYNTQHYQPSAYDKGHGYHHQPSSYEHKGSHGYEQPKPYGHHYSTY